MPINFNIGSFFDKFKNAATREMVTRQLIADSIEKIAGVKLDLKSIELKNKIIRIQTSPAAKNHIFMKKESILTDIKTQLSSFIVADIQ